MSRGWRAYFIGLLLSLIGLVTYGTWVGYERKQELGEQLLERAMQRYNAKTRIARPIREETWKAYDAYRENMVQQALEQAKSRPVGDFPSEPDGR